MQIKMQLRQIVSMKQEKQENDFYTVYIISILLISKVVNWKLSYEEIYMTEVRPMKICGEDSVSDKMRRKSRRIEEQSWE